MFLNAYFLIAVSLLFPTVAQAYIDPGSGSILIQVVIGAIAAGGILIKLYIKRIRKFFGKSDPESK